MARLRAMRRGRRKGGMFKGVTHVQLGRLVADAEARGEQTFIVKDGNGEERLLRLEKAKKMLDGFRNMTDFWRGKTRQKEVTTLENTTSVEVHMNPGRT